MLAWRGTNYPKDRFFHKGEELANAICGAHSRFQICEVRTVTGDKDYPYGLAYDVRDAQTVTDAEVKAGVRPKVIRRFYDAGEAEAWCLSVDPPTDLDG